MGYGKRGSRNSTGVPHVFGFSPLHRAVPQFGTEHQAIWRVGLAAFFTETAVHNYGSGKQWAGSGFDFRWVRLAFSASICSAYLSSASLDLASLACDRR